MGKQASSYIRVCVGLADTIEGDCASEQREIPYCLVSAGQVLLLALSLWLHAYYRCRVIRLPSRPVPLLWPAQITPYNSVDIEHQ